MTPREIEKLKVLGFVEIGNLVHYSGRDRYFGKSDAPDAKGAWAAADEWVRSEHGLKATMADKVLWFCLPHLSDGHGIEVVPLHGKFIATSGWTRAEADSPEAAVDALFWKVP